MNAASEPPELLPDASPGAIATLAASVLARPLCEIGLVERIKGGLTNTSWRVQCGSETVVVRVSDGDEAALQIDRSDECRVLAWAQGIGLGPEVLRCEPHRRLLVTRYIEGRQWNLAEAQSAEATARVARLLRHLHAQPCPAGIQVLDLVARLRHYTALLGRSPDPEIERIACDLAGDARRSLCHNDVHHLNLIETTERLWLLDWEYAALGDPWFDLAGVCCYHALSPQLEDDLLRAYLEAGPPETPWAIARDRLERSCRVFDHLRTLWLDLRDGTTQGD